MTLAKLFDAGELLALMAVILALMVLAMLVGDDDRDAGGVWVVATCASGSKAKLQHHFNPHTHTLIVA